MSEVKVLKNFNFSLFISPTKIIASAKEKVAISLDFINFWISYKLKILILEKIFFNLFSKFIFKETK